MKKAFLLLSIAAASISAFGQGEVSGKSITTGPALWEFFAGGSGGPLIYLGRTDGAVFGTGATGELLPSACGGVLACLANAYNASATTGHQGAKLSYTGSPTQAPPALGTTVSGTNINGLNSYLAGAGTCATDVDFGTVDCRMTDATQYSSVICSMGGAFGSAFNMGSSGDGHFFASDMTKFIVLPTGNVANLMAFNPLTGIGTPSDLCGSYFLGAPTFSGTDPHTLYMLLADQENTVQFTSIAGSFETPEEVTNGTASALLQAINPGEGFAQFGVATGTPSGLVWRGANSGATLTATANPGSGSINTSYANTIYKGILNDIGPPNDWSVSWSLAFNFNYLPAMAVNSHFPAAPSNCLPQNYNASYNGLFMSSDDDTTFSVILSDNGQASHTGNSGSGSSCPGAMGSGAAGSGGSHTCTGPVYTASYRQGQGCRVFNSITDQISGDWGTTGQALNGQAYVIPVSGSITGTLTPGDALKQLVTGAEAQITCAEDSTQACNTSSVIQVEVGLIYTNGTPADGTHIWQDCGTSGTACSASNEFTPSGAPVNAPFYYPDVLHDASQQSNAAVAKITVVQQPNMKVTQVSYNASLQQTTILYNNSATYSFGQQFNFAGLAGADDQYLNCLTLTCPILTAIAGGQSGTITITDTQGGASNYTDVENPANALMYPNSQGGRNGFVGVNYWQVAGLVLHPALQATGHAALGFDFDYQGKFYTAANITNPSMPATTTGNPDGPLYGITASPADYQTPPPNANLIQMLPFSVTDDQHGSNNGHGLNDYSPPGFVTTQVCAQATSGGVGGFPCELQYASLWDAEIVAIENWVSRSSPGFLVGADCNYGSGAAPCVYRLGHTFNTGDNWNFNSQNAIGRMSPDGNWFFYPTDWNKTFGCMDLTKTICWSSWQATAPTASGTATHWATDGASNVTVTMPNSFCPTSGSQYYCTGTTAQCNANPATYVQPISCGTRAGTVKLTGFSESWLNNLTLNLGPNTANNWQCDSTDSNAGVCNKFVLSSVTGAPANSSGTETSTQKATPTPCGTGVPCQRPDIVAAHISTAHQ